MEVILDGVPVKQRIDAGNITFIVENYLKRLNEEDKVLVTFKINNIELDSDQPLEALRINLEEGIVETVEVITQARTALVHDTITTGVDYAEKLINATRQFAADINAGKSFNQELWQNLTDGLEWLTSVCFLVDSPLNSLSGIEASPGDIVQSFNKILIDTVEAMAADDMVAVADLLEYELAEKLEQIMGIFEVYISKSNQP
ncbi:MAG: hypothetical protein FH756_09030 [Firmicutes bacterium]|nr:hypothetical protein [Bacillota bacterium]